LEVAVELQGDLAVARKLLPDFCAIGNLRSHSGSEGEEWKSVRVRPVVATFFHAGSVSGHVWSRRGRFYGLFKLIFAAMARVEALSKRDCQIRMTSRKVCHEPV
jgi:hypothetical protein